MLISKMDYFGPTHNLEKIMMCLLAMFVGGMHDLSQSSFMIFVFCVNVKTQYLAIMA